MRLFTTFVGMRQSQHILMQNLDKFIRKYYLNRLLRGSIILLCGWSLYLLFILVLEYSFRFGSIVRTSIFFSLLLWSVWLLWTFILVPLFELFHLRKGLSKKQAAKIIGDHFPEVGDRLLNVLELEQFGESHALAMASIEQKASSISHLPFTDAVSIKKNLKKMWWLAIPVLIFAGFQWSGKSAVLAESGSRILQFQKEFVPPAPFAFEVVNEQLLAEKGEDFTVEIKVNGEALPSSVYLHTQQGKFLCQRVAPDAFVYVFSHIRDKQSFSIQSGEVKSKDYVLDVLSKASLKKNIAVIRYPSYTGLANDTLLQAEDFSLLKGSRVTWWLTGENAESLQWFIGKDSGLVKLGQSIDYQFFKSSSYRFELDNPTGIDYVMPKHQVQVVNDAYPKIKVEEYQDSLSFNRFFFDGLVNDDYGFSSLTFFYRLDEGEFLKEALLLDAGTNQFPFTHYFELDSALEEDAVLEYYFEVGDNDGISGFKYSQTQRIRKKLLGKESLRKEKIAQEEKRKEDLEKLKESQQALDEDLKDMQNRLKSGESLSQEELLKMQEMLQQRAAEQKHLDEALKPKSSFDNTENSVQEKMKQLEELMEELMDEEMKNLLEEIQESMDKLSEEQLLKKLEELDKKNEQLNKELDRNLELMKQLQVEERLEEAIDKLEEIQEELDKAMDESDLEKANELQEDINEKFEELSKELNDLDSLNQSLEFKNPLDVDENLQERTKEDLKDAKKNLEEGGKQGKEGAKKEQEQAKQKMEDLKEKLSSAQEKMQEEKPQEDMESLRQLLDNLVRLSLDQESLMDRLGRTQTDDPVYKDLIREQYRIQSDAQVVEDSLWALAKRVVQIEPHITRDLNEIIERMERGISDMAERQQRNAMAQQQYVMMSANNLALLLDEVLQQMQQQMSNSMEGEQNCQKPGSGKPKPGNKQGLKNQLKQQKDALEQLLNKGQQPGAKPGQGQPGGDGMSKEFARAMARQEAIRKQLQELANELGSGSQGFKSIQKAVEASEDLERELSEKKISPELLKRQQEIETRLLEAESAEREREKDPMRESQSAGTMDRDAPDALEFLKELEKGQDQLKYQPLRMKPFYKQKVLEYLNRMPNDNN